MDVQIGVIGFGWMAFYHYKDIIPKDEGVKIVSAFDIDPARLEFAQSLGITPYDKLDAFFKSGINTVLVATPNDKHKEYCIAALNAGMNVICEKPVTLSAEDLKEVIKVSEAAGKLFTVHHNRRKDRDFCIVKKAVEDGLIGKPFFIESRVQGANGIPSDWRRVEEAGGGMVLDWGIHLVDQLLYMVKEPVIQVYSLLKYINYTVDDNIKIFLEFEGGLSAQVEVCTTCFQSLPRWHVLGSDGTLDIKDFACEGSIVRGTVKEVDWSLEAVKTAAGSTRTMRPRPEDTIETLPLPDVKVQWTDYYRNFYAAANGKAELLVKPQEVLRTMQVNDLIFASAKQGKSIECRI
ncbi:MAG: Gfo/Idh/MocA family oxidoreductase [Clostridiales bacterium]|jgi:predicted dehydrogenase|nr:Gfo/Idh/MocA family oxidoreductase [Clostridiales bacterium]